MPIVVLRNRPGHGGQSYILQEVNARRIADRPVDWLLAACSGLKASPTTLVGAGSSAAFLVLRPAERKTRVPVHVTLGNHRLDGAKLSPAPAAAEQHQQRRVGGDGPDGELVAKKRRRNVSLIRDWKPAPAM